MEFAYDGSGRRIRKQVKTRNDSTWTTTTDRRFLYDGWNLIAEFDANATNSTLALVRSYTWGLDLSGSMQGAGGVGGLLWTTFASPATTHAFLADGNGNVIASVDAATGLVSHADDYSPFGETIPLSGSRPGAFGFSSKYTDVETGLLYYGFRYYNPSTGRWLSRDPIGENGGVNLYGFVGNRPTYDIDPLGQASFLDIIAGEMPHWSGGTVIKFQKAWTVGPLTVAIGPVPVPLYASFGVEGKIFACVNRTTRASEVWFEGAANIEGFARWGFQFDERPRYPAPKGRDRNVRVPDPSDAERTIKLKNLGGRVKDPVYRDQGVQGDVLNNECRICPDAASAKLSAKLFARAAIGGGIFGFYGNIEKEVASTEEVEGFRYNLGMGSGITGGTVEVGISVSAPKFAVPLKR